MVKDVQTNKQKSEIFCLIITDHTSWPCARWHRSLSQTICGRAQSRHCSVLGETKWSSTRSYPLRSYEVRKRKKFISKHPEKDRKGIVEKRIPFSEASSVSDLECSVSDLECSLSDLECSKEWYGLLTLKYWSKHSANVDERPSRNVASGSGCMMGIPSAPYYV